jgi:hypothetical protein
VRDDGTATLYLNVPKRAVSDFTATRPVLFAFWRVKQNLADRLGERVRFVGK